MRSPFSKLLKVSPAPSGDESWCLLESYRYPLGSRSGEWVVVERGFVTDFASIPWGLRFLLPKWGHHDNAAVLHDYLYWQQKGSRKDADRAMKEAMEDCVPAWKRNLIYAAIRAGGWRAWRKNRLRRIKGASRVLEPDRSAVTYAHLPNKVGWRLLESHRHRLGTEGGESVDVEEGFVLDFRFIPWGLSSLLLPDWGRRNPALLVHDYLYWQQGSSRKEADRLMKEAMEGVPTWKRHLMYGALRCLGWVSWRRNNLDRQAGFERVVETPRIDPYYRHKRPGPLSGGSEEGGLMRNRTRRK